MAEGRVIAVDALGVVEYIYYVLVISDIFDLESIIFLDLLLLLGRCLFGG